MTSLKYLFVLSVCFAACLTSCYRMPGEDEFSVVPTTNNPSVTCEKSTGLMPSVPY